MSSYPLGYRRNGDPMGLDAAPTLRDGTKRRRGEGEDELDVMERCDKDNGAPNRDDTSKRVGDGALPYKTAHKARSPSAMFRSCSCSASRDNLVEPRASASAIPYASSPGPARRRDTCMGFMECDVMAADVSVTAPDAHCRFVTSSTWDKSDHKERDALVIPSHT